MLAIFKRELHSYFTTSTGYVFLAVSLALSGFVLGLTTLMFQTSDTSSYFVIMTFLLIIIMPILTMKIFSDEKRTKTEQLLLTSPISVTSMVVGKFLAAFCMFVISTLISLINFIIVFHYSIAQTYRELGPNMALLIGNMIAMLLLGMAFIAIGIFISSLTENQFAAVVITIGVLLALLLINLFSNLIKVKFFKVVLSWISVYGRFSNFTRGLFDIPAIIYYISIAGIFLFLTVRVFESRRYR